MAEGGYQKYDHSEAIKDQIQRVNKLISEMDTESEQGFKQYYSKCFMGLASLDALIDPFREDGEDPILENVNPMKKSRAEKLQFITESMREMMNFLDDEGIFYSRRKGRRET